QRTLPSGQRLRTRLCVGSAVCASATLSCATSRTAPGGNGTPVLSGQCVRATPNGSVTVTTGADAACAGADPARGDSRSVFAQPQPGVHGPPARHMRTMINHGEVVRAACRARHGVRNLNKPLVDNGA